MGFKSVLMIAACASLIAGVASAAEPLQDRIWYHSRAGTLHHPAKGAIALPASERLRALAAAETCSAMGGPRGVYKYMSGKLWLAGLHRCSGGIGLSEVYPAMRTPPVAQWVSGVLVARLGKRLCTAASGLPVMEAEVTMTVKQGVVETIVEKVGDARTCPAAKAK